MVWIVKGKRADGTKAELTHVGSDNEETARFDIACSQPGFLIKSMKQVEAESLPTVWGAAAPLETESEG